jgi:hypothetical protein
MNQKSNTIINALATYGLGVGLGLAAGIAGCSSTDTPTPKAVTTGLPPTVDAGVNADASPDASPQQPLRPGIEDSSKLYKGTPSANETAFWEAVRTSDDAARAIAVAGMKADIEKDPTNGYSQFLVGASLFMSPNSVLRDLAEGKPTGPGELTGEAVPYLSKSLTNLKDPLYIGFAGVLLASLQLGSGDFENGGKTFAAGFKVNPLAGGITAILGKLQQKDAPGALADMYQMLDYCNRGPVDRKGADAEAFAVKQNEGTLSHRECYSGYHAMHGSEGMLVIAGDLHAINNDQAAAALYYRAAQKSTNYPTWALKPLVERRLSSATPIDMDGAFVLSATCQSCHTNTLK